MAGSVNKVILVGNLGRDPEVRRLESGTAVATFSLATNETYTDKSGERRTITEWHNVVLWRGLAEIAEKYLRKGSLIYLEGKLRTRSWEDQDKNTRYTTEVVADNMTMLGGRNDGGGGAPAEQGGYSAPAANNTASTTNTSATTAVDDDDDLPF